MVKMAGKDLRSRCMEDGRRKYKTAFRMGCREK